MAHKAYVFNLVRSSLVDGWGIRSTVFLKGCPLRCKWCCNPEGQRFAPELRLFHDKCNGCGACLDICPTDALSLKNDHVICQREKCNGCGHCISICPNQALDIFGRLMSTREVFEIVRKDKDYYSISGGGLTIGGGEASQFPDFCLELISMCHKEGISVAIDTCGYAPLPENMSVLEQADLLLYDIKGLDPERHQANTNVDNTIIWENLLHLDRLGKELIVRIPVIPKYNDQKEELEGIAQRLATLQHVRRVDLICYHQFGAVKYQQLDLPYPIPDSIHPISAVQQQRLLSLFQQYGLNVQLGG